jgi:hypothetical protein
LEIKEKLCKISQNLDWFVCNKNSPKLSYICTGYIHLQVGIAKDHITLALEPEVAAIYVITEAKTVLTRGTEPFSKYDPGEKILVADLGGK